VVVVVTFHLPLHTSRTREQEAKEGKGFEGRDNQEEREDEQEDDQREGELRVVKRDGFECERER
jgi:hypothetical protein